MRATEKLKRKSRAKMPRESGFSLVEMIIAILVMTVMMLGTLSVFTYAVHYNRGNNLRSQALTVLQQEAEIYRSSKFTPAVTDSITDSNRRDIRGGAKPARIVTSIDGTVFNVNVTIDNDPDTAGIQTSAATPETLSSGKACTLKEIKITVTPTNASAAWQTAIVTELTIQRVRSN